MTKYTSKEIRKMWLNFWKSKNHEIIESKSLIPINDSSLLWINSGVATLKDYFSGKKLPKNPRITNSQKSIRTSDIENVGVTARHHTLFEMLGNFSIGDYFKHDALIWAYEFIFDVIKLKKDKIYITYYEKDQYTYKKWIELGITKNHLIKGNKKTNFWDLGQGPCGPDTEIFYDRGQKYDPQNIGLKLLKEDLENDRYIEIWNIVFSQFNNDGKGNYTELKQKNIDTGAGLERIVSIVQDTPTNFETDLFLPIIKEIEKMTNQKYEIDNYFTNKLIQKNINKHFKIIADHIRAVTQAIQDGAKPSNTSRGYIIRRLLRRAYRSGIQLEIKQETFLYKLVKVVAEIFDIYPLDVKKVADVIQKEEISFAKTIKQGEELLLKSIKGKKELDFKIAFKLFETYGFPIELTKELLDEKNIFLDISKFSEYQKKHAKVSQGNKVNKAMQKQIKIMQEIPRKVSSFIGYTNLEIKTKIIFQGQENNKNFVLLEKTPFYATGGGQICDKGTINKIEVLDVIKDAYGNNWHIIKSKIINKVVNAKVDQKIRMQKSRNHSATHLLGAALRKVLGNDVAQLGSENDEKRLRFDFPSNSKPTIEQIVEIENLVNNYIKANHHREYIETDLQKAKKMGAIALKNEDYDNLVRVVNFDKISKEFCGGTHIENTKIMEKFKIIKLDKKGANIYRIEAITSKNTITKFEDNLKKQLLNNLKLIIEKNQKINPNYQLNNKTNSIKEIENLIEQVKKDNKNLNKQKKQINIDFKNICFEKIDGKLIYTNMNINVSQIKPLSIKLREKFPQGLIILGAKTNKNTLIAIASKKYDCQKEQKIRFPNMKGGGFANFIMGKIPWEN